MEIQYDITKKFEKDLDKLSKENRALIDKTIDKEIQLLSSGKSSSKVYRPPCQTLPNGFESTIFVMRAGLKLRIIFMIDDDPIFGRKIITLLRIATHDTIDLIFQRIYQSINESILAGD